MCSRTAAHRTSRSRTSAPGNTRRAERTYLAHPGYLDTVVPEGDHRISRVEWKAALPKVREAAASWAPYLALQNASASDFDVIDVNRGGFVDLQEFCEWVEAAEKLGGRPIDVLVAAAGGNIGDCLSTIAFNCS